MSHNLTGKLSLEDVIEHLILYCESIDDIGLYYGKSGIALALYAYSQYTSTSVYQDLACEILQECLDSISLKTENSFDTGVSGIGWIIWHLHNRGILNINPDDILVELDTKIMDSDIHRMQDFSFDSGLRGVSFYVWCRISSSTNIFFDIRYLNRWKQFLYEFGGSYDRNIDITDFSLWRPLLGESLVFGKNQELVPSSLYFPADTILKNQIMRYPIGIKSGIAGLGLKLMNYL
ncbi:MAG: hypothetical protein HDS15_00205 [Bacteroides sp.]|nr:hypothetical protein [Bacteroides sp.]